MTIKAYTIFTRILKNEDLYGLYKSCFSRNEIDEMIKKNDSYTFTDEIIQRLHNKTSHYNIINDKYKTLMLELLHNVNKKFYKVRDEYAKIIAIEYIKSNNELSHELFNELIKSKHINRDNLYDMILKLSDIRGLLISKFNWRETTKGVDYWSSEHVKFIRYISENV